MRATSSIHGIAPFAVRIANGRTKTADEWAAEIVDRMEFAAKAIPQMEPGKTFALKEHVFAIIRDNLALALRHEREFDAGMAENAGCAELARIMRSR